MLCDNVFEDVVSIYIVSILKVNRTWAQHSSGPYYVSACVCVCVCLLFDLCHWVRVIVIGFAWMIMFGQLAEKGITCEGTVYVLPSFDFLGGLK